jgi:hypothetical protein
MLGRLAAIASVAVLASCAGMESASRDARTGGVSNPAPAAAPAPAPSVARDLPPPAPSASAAAPVAAAPPPPQASAAPAPVAAAPQPTPADSAPQEQPRRIVTQRDAGDVVVPGVRERQVQPPQGDPRSVSERMEDIRSWDQCVTRVQAAFESDPMNPQLDSPEEYCSQSLGMANRNAVPLSREERRRN